MDGDTSKNMNSELKLQNWEKRDKTESSKDKAKKWELKLFEIESGEEIVKEYINSFLIERGEYQWLWERNVWRGKSKKCSSTNKWKDKKTGDVFIVSWFFHLKP